jgi:CheY-like chemotaxis protein
MERAFEPFFTTKDFGKGSGLGLAQVYGFAKQAGGRAWLENNSGGGLSVHFELPRSAHAAPVVKPAVAAMRDERSAEGSRVLLVEDDASVADVIHQLLSRAGFACRHAASAAEAISALEGENFDVVFSDIVMPGGMNGVELARTIRTRWPRLPIVLATGYSARAELNPGEFLVFQKPYDPDRLISALKASARAAPPS